MGIRGPRTIAPCHVARKGNVGNVSVGIHSAIDVNTLRYNKWL